MKILNSDGFLYTVSASLQCAYSIFHNDFLGRILFKKLPKKWTFDLKMRILFKKLPQKRTFDKVRSQFKMRSVMTRIRYINIFPICSIVFIIFQYCSSVLYVINWDGIWNSARRRKWNEYMAGMPSKLLRSIVQAMVF